MRPPPSTSPSRSTTRGSRGVIIATASIAGFEGQIGQDAYGASKGGIIALTLIAARDLAAAGIRVVAIAPGTINTPAYGKAAEQIEAYWGPQVPHPRRMGRPDEYAKLAIAIAENDYLNGTVIRLDGALRFPPKLSGGIRVFLGDTHQSPQTPLTLQPPPFIRLRFHLGGLCPGRWRWLAELGVREWLLFTWV